MQQQNKIIQASISYLLQDLFANTSFKASKSYDVLQELKNQNLIQTYEAVRHSTFMNEFRRIHDKINFDDTIGVQMLQNKGVSDFIDMYTNAIENNHSWVNSVKSQRSTSYYCTLQ